MAYNTVNALIECSLPTDIWSLIASILDNDELAGFKQVCKLFNGIGSDTILLQPLYNRLRAFDKTLPADLQTAAKQADKTPSVFFKEAFEKIQTRQQLEIAYLTQHRPAIMATPAYATVLQQNTSVTLKSLEAKHALLDAVNSEIVTAYISINSTMLNLDGAHITRLPVVLFKAAGYANFWGNLTFLDCDNNQLAVLNLTGLAALQNLYCSKNQLTALNVTGLTALQLLECNNNQLTALNVQGLVALQNLDCTNNQLTALDVTGLAALQELDCSDNQLTALDVTGLAALQKLECNDNQLTKLNVQGLVALQELSCSDNQLTSLNVQGLMALQELGCRDNQLTALNVQGLMALQWLTCNNNRLTALNMTGLSALQILECNNNQLAALDVTGLMVLETLVCSRNRLTALNVTGLAALKILECNNNQLAALDVTGLTVLQDLYYNHNPLTSVPAAIKNQYAKLNVSLLFKQLNQAGPTYLPYSGAHNNPRTRSEEQAQNDNQAGARKRAEQ